MLIDLICHGAPTAKLETRGTHTAEPVQDMPTAPLLTRRWIGFWQTIDVVRGRLSSLVATPSKHWPSDVRPLDVDDPLGHHE